MFSKVFMKYFANKANHREIVGGTDRKQGFVLLPLLLFLMVCSGIVLSYMRNVYQELEAAREFLCRKQLETVAQSFMFTALQQEKEIEITDSVYSLEPLQPGNDAVQVCVTVNRERNLGLRFLKVDVADSCENEFSLRQCRMDIPEFLLQQFEQASFITQDSIAKDFSKEENTASITGKKDGAFFPQFSVEEISVWASTNFPSALELQRDGLGGWIYLCKEKYTLPKGLTVNGEGILAFTKDAAIGDNSVFTGRIIILADRDLIIGSQVRIEKALLLCKGKLTVGSDSFINGAVMVQQDTELGERVTIAGDREVLEPFQSIISY